ncbi:hypothetical protein V8C35DRAFT_285658 [Trichoderma chlorosporum]
MLAVDHSETVEHNQGSIRIDSRETSASSNQSKERVSLKTGAMEGDYEMTTIPQDISPPWSHVTRFRLRHADYDYDRLLLNRAYSSSAEEDTNDSIPSLGHSYTSTDVSSIETFSADNDDADENTHQPHKEVLVDESPLLGLVPIDVEIPQHHDLLFELEDVENQAEDTLLVAESDNTTATGCQPEGALPAVGSGNIDANGQASEPHHTACDEYECVTQPHGCSDAHIGFAGEIPRWAKGSVISYVVCKETFPSSLSPLIEDGMKAAIDLWQFNDVSFKQVDRNDLATFAVTYDTRDYRGYRRKVYASAFFPNEKCRELIIYPRSCKEPDFLANILAHEIGHILGLRHEFADTDLEELKIPSVALGDQSPESIMNRHSTREYKVTDRDWKDLRDLYALESEYNGWSVVDIDPDKSKIHFPFSGSSSASSANSIATEIAHLPTSPVLYRIYIFIFMLFMLFILLLVLIFILFFYFREAAR